VSGAEEECGAANVEENDYTVFTGQDLAFELELVVQAVGKKIAFIDNQVRCRPALRVAVEVTIRGGLTDRIAEHVESDAGAAGAV
jgi:hypothetical protein